jgi:glycosyltransferase involved in cell wall biosynthesis
MKICLVSLGFYPDTVGGRAVYAYNLYKELIKKRGLDIRVLTGFWNKKIKDPRVKQFKIIKKRYLWVPLLFIQCLKELWFKKFDIIHAVGDREAILCYFSFKKYITTVHDTGPFEVRQSILHKFISLIASRALRIIVPSKTVKIQLKKHVTKINEDKIKPILNGIDVEKFHPISKDKAAELKKKLGLKGKIILYMGRISVYKGIEDIITAYLKIKDNINDLNLIIAGKTSPEMANKYEIWKKKYPEIIFPGFVPDEEIVDYYGIADVFVTYSWAAEGFGFTPLEAMACGIPVVSSNHPVFREILKDKAILVPPKRKDLLSNSLEKVLKDDKLAEKLVNEGVQYVKDNYSWKKTADNYEKLYKDLVKS